MSVIPLHNLTVFPLNAGLRPMAGKNKLGQQDFLSGQQIFFFFMFENCQRWDSGWQVLKPKPIEAKWCIYASVD